MKKIKRVLEVLTKEGLYTFAYLVRDNLRAKYSPGKKYRTWIKLHESRKAEPVAAGEQPFFTLLVSGREGQADSFDLSGLGYANLEALPVGNRTLKELLEEAKGEYIGFLPADVILAPDALMRIAGRMWHKFYEGCGIFYGDEDVVIGRRRTNPFFKPDFSPDTLRSFHYMGCFFVKREWLEQLECTMQTPVRFNAYLVALELELRLGSEMRNHACHIPEVLSHRMSAHLEDKGAMGAESSDMQHMEQGQAKLGELAEAKKELFAKYGIAVDTEPVMECGAVRLVYEVKGQPMVSIIIPSKDNPSILQMCLDSISACTRYDNYELVIVDNGSSEENREKYKKLCDSQKKPCRYHYEPMEFNFSRMCNIGAKWAQGEYLLFLNDDIEITDIDGHDWLERMVGHASQPHIGAVGAKLYYPDSRKIQHVGVVNYESGAAHIFSKMEDEGILGHGRNLLEYNYSIVTGACLMVAREKFEKIGGFAEELAVTFNDVELCFRLLKQGWYQVVRSDVVLYHHESISRGEDALDEKKFQRHMKERERLFAMHPEFVKADAFYSKNSTQKYLDDSVNTDRMSWDMPVYQEDEKTSKVWQETDDMVCHVEYAKETDRICVRGFAYMEHVRHNNLNQIVVMLKGEEKTSYIRACRIYNPTIAPQMDSDKNLNFVEFQAGCSSEQIGRGQYQLGVALKPFGSGTVFWHMSDCVLQVNSGN